MRFSFSSLFRLIVISALASATAAVVVSRLDPPAPSFRLAQGVKYAGLSGFYWASGRAEVRWLDLETGTLADAPIAPGETLDTASISPWKDEKGQSQIVGRWSKKEPGTEPVNGLSNQFGLARYRFPSGERIDHVTTEIIPAGPVSWFPGNAGKVMFNGGDGNLYRFSFDPNEATGEPDTAPVKVGLAEGSPIAEQLDGAFLCDLHWPTDPRLGGLAVLSLRIRTPINVGNWERARYSRGQVWWVRFNQEGSRIVSGGRLFRSDDRADLDERAPTLAVGPDGQPLVSFKLKRPGHSGWELRVADLSREALAAGPNLPLDASRLIAAHHSASPAPLSPDGRRIYSLTQEPGAKQPSLKAFPVERAAVDGLAGRLSHDGRRPGPRS